MKKKVLFLLLFLVLLSCSAVYADQTEQGFTFYNQDGFARIKAYDGSQGSIVTIPDELGGLPPGIIDDKIFYGLSEITEVRMPDTITSIGSEAFRGCSSLKTVHLSTAIQNLWQGAFQECTALVSIQIPPQCLGIYSSVFQGCVNLKEVEFLGNKLSTIESMAFWDCISLTEISFPSSLSMIGSKAFYNCPITKIELPDNTTNIAYDGFPGLDDQNQTATWKLYCNKESKTAKYISLTRSNTANYLLHDFYDSEVGEDLLLRWENDPDLGEVICVASYTGTGGKVTIPEGVQKICGSAFQNQKLVTAVSFPDTLLRIDDSAFYGTGLKKVDFPSSLILLGNHAFSDCSSLTTVNLERAEQLSSIPAYCFHKSTALKEVILSSQVYYVGEYAFCGCSGLTELPMMNGVTYIGERAFENCAGLTTAILPDSLGASSLGEGVFANCSSLRHVELPNNPGFDKLPKEMFFKCTSLVSIDLKYVTEYSTRIFFGCSSLVSLVIPEETTQLPSDFAIYCGALKAVQIPATVQLIKDTAFTTDKGYNFVVFGEPNTAAERWAKKYKNVEFRSMNTEDLYFLGPDKWNTRNCFVGEEINWYQDYVIMPKVEGRVFTVTCEATDPKIVNIAGNTLSCVKPGVTKIVAKAGNSSWEYTMHVYERVKSFELPPVIYIGDNYFFKTYDKDLHEIKKVVLENINPSKDYFPAFQYEINFEGWEDTDPDFAGTTVDGQIDISTKDYQGGYGKLKVTTLDGYTKTADLVIFNTVENIKINYPTKNDEVLVGEEVFIDAEITLSVWNSMTDKSTDTVVCSGEEWLYFVPRWEKFGYNPQMDALLEFTESNRFIAKAAGKVFLPVLDVTFKGEDLMPIMSFTITDGSKTAMRLPANLEMIQDNAFANTAFQWLRVGENCEYIGKGAFAGSTKLERVYIPRSVEMIEPDAFGEEGNITIYGKSHSYAEEYAKEHGFQFRHD